MSKRLKFFLSHLSISLMIALCVIGLVFYIWYPTPLATAVGVTHIFLMMLAIDVIVGPILGFLVYKQGKKSLKLDLSVIILIQLSAFIYGFYSIAQGRPVYIAYVVDRFELVRNNDLILDHIDQAKPQFQQIALGKPEFVATEFSQNQDTRSNDMFAEALGGVSIAQKPERYVDFSKAKTQIQQRALDLDTLNQFNTPIDVKNVLNKYPQANAWVPLKANAVDMVVLLQKEKGEVVKIVDLRPWD
ncbi:type IV pilin accessory protein [Acinetobacter sp. WCHAc060033]|uniref:TfpX/TfpZ family type IV pilin accessory protein n=1 Tax=Acinetobacter sp. WCHAc060033 TaxID=2518624 RepID=UPI001023895F|nr:TfpX/TfpZ family type IV pilin accessory protein [Acinetobacter sp. WCHAc060033]RZG88404.1 type IV pilin accessory protein [Acinetobacter sp. WCHAc060033]